jgi:hypothetical protein
LIFDASIKWLFFLCCSREYFSTLKIWGFHEMITETFCLLQLWHAGTSFFFLAKWLTGEGTVWPGSVKDRNVLRCCNSSLLCVVLPAGTQTQTAYWALPVFVFHTILLYILIKFIESKMLNVKTQTTKTIRDYMSRFWRVAPKLSCTS